MMMEIEYEAKFYPIDKEEIRNKLESIGAKLIVPERIMRRTMFGNESNPNMKCNYIRVRDEGDKITFSAKVHADSDGVIKDQKETVVVVDNFENAVKILEIAGLNLDMYQESLRETWMFEEAEIVIDTWPGLEPYVEIEANSEEKVKNIAKQLGFEWDSKIITAISYVYADVYDLTTEEVLGKIANITFEENPFEDMDPKE